MNEYRTDGHRRAAKLRALSLLVGLSVVACGAGDAGAEGEAAESEPAAAPAAAAPARPPADIITELREIEFASELEVDLDRMEERDSGLFVRVLESGSGPPAGFGDEMGVHYTLWLPNGQQVDSSRGGEPFGIVLGSTPLIDGWVEGVTGMRLGEKRKLVLPYGLGYGERGAPPRIPPYSPLVFEVELAEHVPTGEG